MSPPDHDLDCPRCGSPVTLRGLNPDTSDGIDLVCPDPSHPAAQRVVDAAVAYHRANGSAIMETMLVLDHTVADLLKTLEGPDHG